MILEFAYGQLNVLFSYATPYSHVLGFSKFYPKFRKSRTQIFAICACNLHNLRAQFGIVNVNFIWGNIFWSP